jgi:hypothetical protein
MKNTLARKYRLGLLLALMSSLHLQADQHSLPTVAHETLILNVPDDISDITHKIIAGQKLMLPFVLSEVTLKVHSPDLIVSFKDPSHGQLILVDYMSFNPAFGDIVDKHGTPVDLLDFNEQAVIEAIQAQIESGDEIDEIETAAGGPLGGLPVFGWLADRFNINTPSLVSTASAETSITIPALATPLLDQIQMQLVVIRNQQIAKNAKAYHSELERVYSEIKERKDSGQGSLADFSMISAWLLDAKIEVIRADSRLIMAVDAHQDHFGSRCQAASNYSEDWQNRLPKDIEELLSITEQWEMAVPRRSWQEMEMERDSLSQYVLRMEQLFELQESYMQQFSLGQTSLQDVIGTRRHIYDVNLQKNDTHYRYVVAQAKLLAMTNRLFEGDLLKPVEQ